MASWERIGYAALCVLVPVVWGLLVVWISNRIDKRIVSRHSPEKGEDAAVALPPLDYHI